MKKGAPDLGGADKVMGKNIYKYGRNDWKNTSYGNTEDRERGKFKARILVKLELFNPAGSIKDRAALSMMLDAEKGD